MDMDCWEEMALCAARANAIILRRIVLTDFIVFRCQRGQDYSMLVAQLSSLEWPRATVGKTSYVFDLAADDFVSLRMLIPLRKENSGHDNIGANAPSLVMGGTTTAITMCWNLLNEIPYAYKALTGTTPSRSMVESIWSDTRELIFRVGAGSLTAFVSFASALSSDPSAMVWEGCAKLSLTKEKERFVWTMDDELAKNITQIHKTISAHQGNEYYGCTALYAKTQPLPLNSQWADKVDSNREQLVFSELVRFGGSICRCV